MFSQRMVVAEDDDLHAGSGDGNVHAAQVAKETYLPFVVGTNQGDDDDVALLSLEAVNGIDADESAKGLEVFALHQEAPQILHLGPVG